MRNVWAICKREIKSYFYSPIAYVVIVMFGVIAGWFFFTSMSFYSLLSFQSMQNPYIRYQLNLTEMVIRPMFGNISIIMLLMLPVVTMRLFSEEKKTGTIELLLTYPVSDLQALLGKYIAALCVFLVMLLFTIVYAFLMAWFGTPESGPLITAYIGLLLMGASFIALGLFASSLTENQIVAAIIAFGALLLFWVVGWAASITHGTFADLLRFISITDHFDNFAKGVLDTSDLVYYATFIIFFLFLTLRVLDSKRWRG